MQFVVLQDKMRYDMILMITNNKKDKIKAIQLCKHAASISQMDLNVEINLK